MTSDGISTTGWGGNAMNIELQGIHKRFGSVHANNDISVTFSEGRIVGVLGENGAGKSTLMKILSGYQPADEGHILIDGAEVAYTGPLAAIAHGIGMLQQDPLDVGAFTVLENFMYGQEGGVFFQRKRKAESKKTLLAYAERFGFDLDPDTPIDQLSIPQRQQLEIVRLLALGVKALILDEPTTGISAEQKDTLFAALKELATQEGMIVLLVSHKLEDVIALCDEVIVLRAGVLVGARELPATTQELVALMFGGDLPEQEREAVAIGDVMTQLHNATIVDKRLTLKDVGLDIKAGEVIGLAGLDGSGQEAFMRALAGLHPLQQGSLKVAGHNMLGKPYRNFLANGVYFGASGRLEEGLIAGMTLTEHMALMSDDGMSVDWRKAKTRMTEQIEHFNVRGRPDDEIQQLSGGNQQRVLMALLPEQTRLLILEQPTRGLDVESANWIWKQLLARREDGTSIVFSSAELDEIVTYSDRILVFYAGRIFEVPDASSVTIDQLGHYIGGEFAGDEVATL
jgi:ABC-type uncharacterized transport system ATPase subunit